MPTKLNRAGKQQNYVPKGYGDASGEYGDNATGSNKNFQNFGKPKKTDNIVVEQKDDKPIDTKPTKTMNDLTEAIKKTFGSKLTPNAKKLIKNIEESGAEPELVSLMANLYETGNYSFKLGKNFGSKFLIDDKKVVLGATSLGESDERLKGEVFMHESGHALDHSSKGTNKLYSLDFISKKHNMSLQESVADELKEFADDDKFNELKEKLLAPFQKEHDEIESIYQEYRKINRELINIDNDANAYVNKQIYEKYGFDVHDLVMKCINGEISRDEYSKTRGEMTKDQISFNQEYRKAQNIDLQELSEKRDNKLLEYTGKIQKFENKKFNLLGDLSDMVQAVNDRQICGGHDAGYFSRKSKQATECFAEITSARAINKESYNLLKKYIPRTLEIYDELIEEIQNGK